MEKSPLIQCNLPLHEIKTHTRTGRYLGKRQFHYWCRILGKDLNVPRERRVDGEGKRNRKSAVFTHFLIHKSTLLSPSCRIMPSASGFTAAAAPGGFIRVNGNPLDPSDIIKPIAPPPPMSPYPGGPGTPTPQGRSIANVLNAQ